MDGKRDECMGTEEQQAFRELFEKVLDEIKEIRKELQGIQVKMGMAEVQSKSTENSVTRVSERLDQVQKDVRSLQEAKLIQKDREDRKERTQEKFQWPVIMALIVSLLGICSNVILWLIINRVLSHP
jgi:predicted nuclease with TOPRIM domain